MIAGDERSLLHERLQQSKRFLQPLLHFFRWFELFLQNTLHVLDGTLEHKAIVEEQPLVHDGPYLRITRVERIVAIAVFLHQIDGDRVRLPNDVSILNERRYGVLGIELKGGNTERPMINEA